MTLDDLLKILIGAGLVHGTFQAIVHFFLNDKKTSDWVWGTVQLLIAAGMAQAYGAVSQWELQPAFLNHIFISVIWSAGPISLAFVVVVSDPLLQEKKFPWLSFAPALLILIALPFFDTLGIPMQDNHIEEYFSGSYSVLNVLVIIGLLHFGAHLLYITIRVRKIFKGIYDRLNRPRFWLLVVHGIGPLTIVVVLFLSVIFADIYFIYYGMCGLVLFQQVTAVTRSNMQSNVDEIIESLRTKSYDRTTLMHEDIQILKEELRELMQEKKAFLYEDLNASVLAGLLGLKANQISELLNVHIGMAFPKLIGAYRIEEACRLLRENPYRKVLDVAFEVGFRSKSNFNRVFNSYVGMSPSEFTSAVKSGKVDSIPLITPL